MTDHIKQADPAVAIVDHIANRWSPYALADKPVESEKLQACFEAARWAASSYNEQPWIFFVARREDEAAFEKMLGVLVEPNQLWAKHAGVLVITAYAKAFTRNGNPNRVALHDVGLAVGNLSIQATALGLAVHQMAGMNLSQARQAYSIPESHEVATAIAIGYAADPASFDDASLAEHDQKPRTRKPQAEFVFGESWGRAAEI